MKSPEFSQIRSMIAAERDLSQSPVGCAWRIESMLLNPTLLTSLSLQYRCVFLQKNSLINYLGPAKSVQRQAETRICFSFG
jgi:hypothetical protein